MTRTSILLVALMACAYQGDATHAQSSTSGKAPVTSMSATTPPNAPEMCSVPNTTVVNRFEINDTPGWFFKPFPELPWVAYRGTDSNKILNLSTGETIPIPGERDPVPTPDGKFVTLPGVELLLTDEILAGVPTDQLTRLSAPLEGDYQTTGILASGDNYTDYRFMGGTSSVNFRDFRIRYDKTDSSPNIEPLGSMHTPCPTRQLKLPILSKNGREFVAYDVDAAVTKIFGIAHNLRCQELESLGVATGKASFSFDGRKIAFHVPVDDKYTTTISRSPTDRMVQSVFLYDRDRRVITRLTHNTVSNAYFPAFFRNGNVLYLFKPHFKSAGGPLFVIADPSKASYETTLTTMTTHCDSEPSPTRCEMGAAIGSLWSYVCSKSGKRTSASAATLNYLSLEPERCRMLVTNYWREYRKKVLRSRRKRGAPLSLQFKDMTADDLLRGCTG
ncbi:MAG: hypothetical protein OEU36_10895 [Gammaproteobacteria bacterium]|nr:hypothetical protein [Gammaproteobacteria bacterium]